MPEVLKVLDANRCDHIAELVEQTRPYLNDVVDTLRSEANRLRGPTPATAANRIKISRQLHAAMLLFEQAANHARTLGQPDADADHVA